MTVKTDVSRFHIHDELTAPEGSDKLLKSIAASGGQISKLVGALAGSPTTLRAFARLRRELRAGVLSEATQIRIALAVSERRGDNYSVAHHARSARAIGIGLDEISRARSFESENEAEAGLLRLLKAAVETDGQTPLYLIEETRELDWTDEQIIEALSHVALNEFQSLIANASGLPMDQSDPSILPAAA